MAPTKGERDTGLLRETRLGSGGAVRGSGASSQWGHVETLP